MSVLESGGTKFPQASEDLTAKTFRDGGGLYERPQNAFEFRRGKGGVIADERACGCQGCCCGKIFVLR